MKNLKFKRHAEGQVFDPATASRDTMHIHTISTNPRIVKIYDVDSAGNYAEVESGKWMAEREDVLQDLSGLEVKYNNVGESPAVDILKRIKINTGESINYREVPVDFPEVEVDNFFYIESGGKIYKRVFEGNTIRVSDISFTSDAINKAIEFASVDLSVWSRQKYNIVLSEGTYIISEPIKFRNLEGFSISGEGLQTILQVGAGLNLPNLFDINGVAYSQFKNFSIVIPEGTSVGNVFEMYWGDRVNNTQDISIHPRRSTTQNTFENIRMLSGKFKNFAFLDGHNQNDVSRWIDITVHGDRTGDADGVWWENGFLIGDGSTGNNLLHRFENIYFVGLKNAYHYKAVGGIITSGGASKIHTFVRREGVNETLLVEGVRLESVAQIYTADGYLNGIHDAPENVTFQNMYYSGAFEPNEYFKPNTALPIIFHAGGTFNLIGCTINNFEVGTTAKIKLSGAMNDSFHNNFNIIGSNIQMDFQSDVIADAWANCQLNILGSAELKGTLGTQMGRPYDYWTKKFGTVNLLAKELSFVTDATKKVNVVNELNNGMSFSSEDVGGGVTYAKISKKSAGYMALFFDGFNTVRMDNLESAFIPVEKADGAAANNTIYYSTTASKLVYKDSSGVVNPLY